MDDNRNLPVPIPMNDRDLGVEFARLDERIKSLQREIEHRERNHETSLKIQSEELARRLDILNHAHQEAIRVQGTYVPRETYTRDLKEMEGRFKQLESWSQNLQGRMWLPMIGIGVIAAAVAAAAVKLLFP